MILYIAGKMSGLPDFGRARFRAAQQELEAAGHIVLNPGVLPLGMPDDRYLPICLAMLNAADGIYLLDNWEHSEGATLEHHYACCQDKRIFFEDLRKHRIELGLEAGGPQHTCLGCTHFDGNSHFGICGLGRGCYSGSNAGCDRYSPEVQPCE